MHQEIERKFLVTDDSWREHATGTVFRQGYIAIEDQRTVRVRTKGDQAFLTIKGKSEGAVRLEFEYEIPVADAEALLANMCRRPLIEKTRYEVRHDGLTWEIDEFTGDNAGLLMAEVELNDPDQTFDLPPWAGREVTDDPRYYNANLSQNPYRLWAHESPQ